MVATVEFFFALGSRYSYLASTQIARLEQSTGARFLWRPVNSQRLMDDVGVNPFKSEQVLSGQYAASYRQKDAAAWAEYYGVPFVDGYDPNRHDGDLMVRACTAASAAGKGVLMAHRLFEHIYVRPRPVKTHADIMRVALELGIAHHEMTALMASKDVENQVEKNRKSAIGKEVFGVPTFVCEEHRLFFWGNDRILLLESALKKVT